MKTFSDKTKQHEKEKSILQGNMLFYFFVMYAASWLGTAG
jgi:hypothetical protein